MRLINTHTHTHTHTHTERRARDDDGGVEAEEPRRKRRRLTRSAALSSPSIIEEGGTGVVEVEDVTSEDASYASLVETALSVCSQVDLFD